ncbi:hypothetical protein [uncultured Mailhella sp.]|uniref:hypothetical protein n=1 Tax=uncultured Mailhella sp. TaxID=1981031 RepID=UPI0032087083
METLEIHSYRKIYLKCGGRARKLKKKADLAGKIKVARSAEQLWTLRWGKRRVSTVYDERNASNTFFRRHVPSILDIQ